MHNQRTSIVIAAIAGIIGTFLPFMNAWFMKISLIETKDGTGYIVIVAFVISIIVALVGNHKDSIKKGQLAGLIVSGVIPGVLMLLVAIGNSNDDVANLFTQFNIGFYLVVMASFAILVLGLALNKNDNENFSIKTAEAIYCSKCGKKHLSGSNSEFCDECGNKL